VEICLKDLEQDYAKCPLKFGDPVVSYKETVIEESSQLCLAKSANKHNRIYARASPLGDELTADIEAEKISAKQDPKVRYRALADDYGWDPNEAKKIWCFGPETTGANVLVDHCIGVQYLDTIRDSMQSAF